MKRRLDRMPTAQEVKIEHSLYRFLLPVVENRLRVGAEDLSMLDHGRDGLCRIGPLLRERHAASGGEAVQYCILNLRLSRDVFWSEV